MLNALLLYYLLSDSRSERRGDRHDNRLELAGHLSDDEARGVRLTDDQFVHGRVLLPGHDTRGCGARPAGRGRRVQIVGGRLRQRRPNRMALLDTSGMLSRQVPGRRLLSRRHVLAGRLDRTTDPRVWDRRPRPVNTHVHIAHHEFQRKR